MFFKTTIHHQNHIVARRCTVALLHGRAYKSKICTFYTRGDTRGVFKMQTWNVFSKVLRSQNLVFIPFILPHRNLYIQKFSLSKTKNSKLFKNVEKASLALARETGYTPSVLQNKTSLPSKIPLSGEVLKENFTDIFYTHLEVIAFSLNSVSLNIKIGDYLSSGDKIGLSVLPFSKEKPSTDLHFEYTSGVKRGDTRGVKCNDIYRKKQSFIRNVPTVLPVCNNRILVKASKKSKNFDSQFFFKKSFALAKLNGIPLLDLEYTSGVKRSYTVHLGCRGVKCNRAYKYKHKSSHKSLICACEKICKKICTCKGAHFKNVRFAPSFHSKHCCTVALYTRGVFKVLTNTSTSTSTNRRFVRRFVKKFVRATFRLNKTHSINKKLVRNWHARAMTTKVKRQEKCKNFSICLHLAFARGYTRGVTCNSVNQNNKNKPFYTKPIILPSSGRVLAISKTELILQKTQPLLFYDSATLHVKKGEWVKAGTPILTLTHQTLITGDIVQGIPRIEQLFEAFSSPPPGLKDQKGKAQSKFKNVHDTLHSQVRDIFRKNWLKNVLPIAVRKSLEDIQYVIVEMIQKVYLSQGVLIADKHIEIIIRQMTSKGQILDSGSTGLLLEEVLPIRQIENANITTPGKKCLYVPAVVGLTAAALTCDSFISAASFQETTRVLSRDAVVGKSDFLRGLKEKVVIGDLISAGTGLDIYFIYTLFADVPL